MPITLTELVREIGQSAVALDEVCSRGAYDHFLHDFDNIPVSYESDGVNIPQTERVQIQGNDLEVTRPNLKKQGGLQAKRMRFGLSSDVDLEGRQLQASTTLPADTLIESSLLRFTFTKAGVINVSGFDRKFGPTFGDADIERSVTIGPHTYRIDAVVYNRTNRRLIFRVQNLLYQEDFEGKKLKISAGDHEAILEFNQANYQAALNTGSIYWPGQQDVCEWIRNVENGNDVQVDILQLQPATEVVEQELETPKNYRSEVVVTFKEGLSENSAHLTLAVEFERQTPPEGIHKIEDKLNHDLANQLEIGESNG